MKIVRSSYLLNSSFEEGVWIKQLQFICFFFCSFSWLMFSLFLNETSPLSKLDSTPQEGFSTFKFLISSSLLIISKKSLYYTNFNSRNFTNTTFRNSLPQGNNYNLFFPEEKIALYNACYTGFRGL